MKLGLGLNITKNNRGIGSGDLVYPYILDLYPNAAEAYSLKNLKESTEFVCQIIRTADGAVREATAKDFIGGSTTCPAALWAQENGGSAGVNIWYDQSGNNRHFTASTAANRPVIVRNGGVQYDNGRAMVFQNVDGIIGYMTKDNANYGPAISVLNVAKVSPSITTSKWQWGHTNTYFLGQRLITGISVLGNSTLNTETTLKIVTANKTTTNVNTFINNIDYSGTTSLTTIRSTVAINRSPSSGSDGFQSEMILWNSDLGDEAMADIKDLTNQYYGVWLTSTEVDESLIQAATEIGTTWNNGDTIDLSTDSPRTSASDAAVLQLNNAGITVVTSGRVELGHKLLDFYPGAAHAFSLRLLSKDYTGPAIQVRRDLDDTLLDIGFTDEGDLDEAALTTFVGAGSGYVRTWYDQSGGTVRNATNTSNGQQPRIVNEGVIHSSGIAFGAAGGRDSQLIAPMFLNSGNHNFTYSQSYLTVFKPADTIDSQQGVWAHSSASITYLNCSKGGGLSKYWTTNARDISGDLNKVTNNQDRVLNTSERLYSTYIEIRNLRNYKNGADLSTSVSNIRLTRNNNDLRLGNSYDSSNSRNAYLNGYIKEFIAYKSYQFSNKTGLEGNIMNYYNL